METDRSKICGCKGIRTCLKCEELFDIIPKFHPTGSIVENAYVYCNICDLCWRGWNTIKHSDTHNGESVRISGIQVIENFLSFEEEAQLIFELEQLPWELSQSGRRKQNFGPKCNFKKRKLRVGNFKGFPKCSEIVHKKFLQVDILKDFHTIEQCTLEYDPERGASIDPHIDDCWIWGERIVTVNLLADSVLTLFPYKKQDDNRFNHNFAPKKFHQKNDKALQTIRVPMPRRSLIVLTGEARYSWLHQIFREDICSRRICLAFREFTPDYLPGGKFSEDGKEILEIGKKFW